MEIHVARGPVCTFCDEKLSNGQAFCGKCGQPTKWASHDERVLWDLGQWETSRKHQTKTDRAVASATRSQELAKDVRSRAAAPAAEQPAAPQMAEPGPRRSMLSRFRRPAEPAATVTTQPARPATQPSATPSAPAAAAKAAPAARPATPEVTPRRTVAPQSITPKPVAPKPAAVAQRPAQERPSTPLAKPAAVTNGRPPGSAPASTGPARPSQVARVVRTAASNAPAPPPPARTATPAAARVTTAARMAASAATAPAIAPQPVAEAAVEPEVAPAPQAIEAPVETPRSAPGTPLVIIRRSATTEAPAVAAPAAAPAAPPAATVAPPAPAKPKREKKQKPPKQPKVKKVQAPVAAPKAPKPKKEGRKDAEKRERKHRRHSKRVNRRAASLDLKDGERVSLSIEGWSRFRRATLVVTNYRVALITQVPPQVKWIPLEEVATVSRRWRGAHSVVVSAPTEVLTLQKSKRDMLASFQELLESEVREARRPGSQRHHPDITQEWCDMATQIWDSRFHRVRLWIRRRPAATIVGLTVIGVAGFTLSSFLTKVFGG